MYSGSVAIFSVHLPEAATTSKVLLFADDTKFCHPVMAPSDYDQLQANIERLVCWRNKWKLYFNELKHILMRYHKSKSKSVALNYDYNMEGSLISAHYMHKDQGILLQSDLS